MRRFLVLSISLALGLTAMIAAPIAADDYTCDTGSATPPGLTLDNVIVPEGESCVLRNATVEGSITVKQGAGLNLFSNSRVNGNVQATRCQYLVIGDGSFFVTVFGDVQAHRCKGIVFQSAVVGGDVQIKRSESSATPVQITGSTVYGDLQLKRNTTTGNGASTYGFLLEATSIYGNCQATRNTEPVSVKDVTVMGNAEGQCKP